MTNILCTICMRGNSKEVPNKNISKINGKPLLYYSIKQAKDSNLFNKIVVSTDQKKLQHFLNSMELNVILEDQKKWLQIRLEN